MLALVKDGVVHFIPLQAVHFKLIRTVQIILIYPVHLKVIWAVHLNRCNQIIRPGLAPNAHVWVIGLYPCYEIVVVVSLVGPHAVLDVPYRYSQSYAYRRYDGRKSLEWQLQSVRNIMLFLVMYILLI